MPLEITSMKTTVGELQREYLYKLVVESYPVAASQAYTESALVKGAVDLYHTNGIWPNRTTARLRQQWSGETYYITGTDESNKEGTLTFNLDADMKIKDFFEAWKDLSGDLPRHAAKRKPEQVGILGVYEIDVDKETVTDYRQLIDVLCFSVDGITPNKAGSAQQAFNVIVTWDRQGRDDSKRGLKI